MKRVLIAVAIVFSLATLWTARPEPACAACSSVPCFNSSQCASAGCYCLKTGLSTYGVCASGG